jgi:Sulfate permease family
MVRPYILSLFHFLIIPSRLYGDVIAGLTVGLVLVPQSMSYAKVTSSSLPSYTPTYRFLLDCYLIPGIWSLLFVCRRLHLLRTSLTPPDISTVLITPPSFLPPRRMCLLVPLLSCPSKSPMSSQTSKPHTAPDGVQSRSPSRYLSFVVSSCSG